MATTERATPRERGRHILLVHQLFVLGAEAGGTRHFELARHLVRRGDRVTVVAGSASYLTGARHDAPTAGTAGAGEPGLTVLRPWSWAPGRARAAGFLWRLLSFVSFTVSSVWEALRVADVDVVWGTSPPLFQAVGALVVARVRGVPFVLEIRDLWPDFAVQLGVLRNPVLIGLARATERFLYRHADRLVVNSPGFLAHLEKNGADPGLVTLVPNGVEADDFDPDARGEGFRGSVGAGPADVVVLYSGAHGVPNDLDVFLDAAGVLAHRTDLRWVLVGGGRDKPRLEARARSLGLDNVVFAPAQPKARMPEVVAAADVCVAILKPIPMFDTTYPNKVFDYMAAGRPTVLAIDGVIRTVVEEAGAGVFVPPGDAAALAEAVRVYADDPARRRRDGRAGRDHVARRFRREEHAEVLGRLLEEAVRTRARAPAARVRVD